MRCGCLLDVGRLKPSSAAILTGSTSMIHERCNRLSTGVRDQLSAGLPNDKRGNVMRWAFLLASIMTISLPAMAYPWNEPGDRWDATSGGHESYSKCRCRWSQECYQKKQK